MGQAETGEQTAWTMFWEQNPRGGASGCLPQGSQFIEDAQRKVWQEFARGIPQGGAVLDLATGDGRVLAWIGAARSDLVLTGVDLAPTLPLPPPNVTLEGSVAMEALPFPDLSKDAVTSQFGFEYGDTARAAAEIARVLKPGGTIGLMMHRGDGPIVAHNRTRREQLEWALEDKAIVSRTREAIAGSSDLASAEPYASATAAEGHERFGQSSPAWEIPEAIRRTLLMGARAGRQFVIDTLNAIEAQAGNEIGRIKALIRASTVADDRESIIEQFRAVGVGPMETKTVEGETAKPFADFLVLTKG
ncbi:MAG: class I SAM-dependent methyltransferase [Pseudomonadota bacterium]|jgi:SAM-dependent methyltransferase|nr:class I SAM-dependent methyltransferase [Pseudomonadota bacterium]